MFSLVWMEMKRSNSADELLLSCGPDGEMVCSFLFIELKLIQSGRSVGLCLLRIML